jgi:cytochrome c
MLKVLRNFSCITLLIFVATASFATGVATKADAVAMVKKAGAYYQLHGLEKALVEFNNQKGQFVKDELYLFVYDSKGNNLAHGQNPKMVGKNLLEMRDVDGIFVIKKVLEIGDSKKGNGWQNYKWPNTISKTVEAKSSYTEKFGDLYISCGIYR